MTKHNKPQPDDTALSPRRGSRIITVNQLRAGRTIARLGVRELASAAGLSPTSLSLLENGHTRDPHKTTLTALRAALAARGIDFAPGGWTRHINDAYVEQRPPSGCVHCAEASDLLSMINGLLQQTRGNNGPLVD
jgi:transcriptional regulator with XRE-family HTH domain